MEPKPSNTLQTFQVFGGPEGAPASQSQGCLGPGPGSAISKPSAATPKPRALGLALGLAGLGLEIAGPGPRPRQPWLGEGGGDLKAPKNIEIVMGLSYFGFKSNEKTK